MRLPPFAITPYVDEQCEKLRDLVPPDDIYLFMLYVVDRTGHMLVDLSESCPEDFEQILRDKAMYHEFMEVMIELSEGLDI